MPADPIVVILSLLNANWNPANTEGVTPEFGAGFLEGQGGIHQVKVRNTPNLDATGTSGFHGVSADNGAPAQMFRGMVFLECYAQEASGQPDPDKMSESFANEVRRIVRANINNVADYDYISFLGYNRIPPQQGARPLAVTRSCRIGFQWRIEG